MQVQLEVWMAIRSQVKAAFKDTDACQLIQKLILSEKLLVQARSSTLTVATSVADSAALEQGQMLLGYRNAYLLLHIYRQ